MGEDQYDHGQGNVKRSWVMNRVGLAHITEAHGGWDQKIIAVAVG
ncbi:MAG: hypothetical protein AAF066_05855 [Pseudomonadota bacterium]